MSVSINFHALNQVDVREHVTKNRNFVTISIKEEKGSEVALFISNLDEARWVAERILDEIEMIEYNKGFEVSEEEEEADGESKEL